MMIRQISLHMKTVLLLIFIGFSFQLTFAGNQSEPRLREFREHFKQDYFQLGALFQFVGDFTLEPSGNQVNGFSIGNARLKAAGDLDQGIGYLIQTTLTGNRALLDGKMHYQVGPALRFDAGLFKSPFSAEYLISTADIDFVNRSRVVNAFAPKRQIGLQISGQKAGTSLSYSAGMFNGNGFGPNRNDNARFLYAGRLVYAHGGRQESNSQLEFGANAAYSRDESVSIGGIPFSYQGKRLILGTDVRWESGPWLLSGEWIGISLGSLGEPAANGYHLTAGYAITAKSQILLRLDQLTLNRSWFGSEGSTLLIAGYNLFYSTAAGFQLNYVVNPVDQDPPNNHQILLNCQVSL